MKAVFVSALVFYFLISSNAFAEETLERMRPRTAYELIKEGSGIWVIDIRAAAAYEEIHIEGSVNIPLPELKYKRLPANRLILTADTSPGQKRAVEAASLLKANGHGKVYILDGGLAAWKLEGYPVIIDKDFKSLGVSAAELNEALSDFLPITIYDLRRKGPATGEISGTMHIPGENLIEKMENLRNILAAPEDLSERLAGQRIHILLVPAGESHRELAMIAGAGIQKDVRYLHGGYEAYEALVHNARETRSLGDCPACVGRANP